MLCEREQTIIEIIKNNPSYFARCFKGESEGERTIQVFQRRIVAYFLERGLWVEALRYGFLWRIPLTFNLLLPKLLGSVFVGAIAVLSASCPSGKAA